MLTTLGTRVALQRARIVMQYSLIRSKFLCLIAAYLFLFSGSPNAIETASTAGFAEQYQRADWVSRVRIEGIGSLVHPALSRPQMVAVQAYRYNASVIRAWKGEQAGTIKFQVALSDCPRPLQVDREYIVFGTVDHRGKLGTRSCEDLVGVEEAPQLPAALNEYLDRGTGQAGS